MSFLKNAIRKGVGDAIGKAVGGAIKEAVTPVAQKYANQAAQHIDDAVMEADRQTQAAAQETRQAASNNGFANLENALGNWQRSMESYTVNAAKNMKICPACGEAATADKKFCPACGAKLTEQTVAQGALCPACGKQNTIGTKFCSECGAKLPAAEAEEQANAAADAAALARWESLLPVYPKWNCGGSEYDLEDGNGYFYFTAKFANYGAAEMAVENYRNLAMQNGFVMAGQYPEKQHLYKMVNGACYHIDTEHCFEGDNDRPTIYFNIDEPAGGFYYKKPEPKQKTSIFDLFN